MVCEQMRQRLHMFCCVQKVHVTYTCMLCFILFLIVLLPMLKYAEKRGMCFFPFVFVLFFVDVVVFFLVLFLFCCVFFDEILSNSKDITFVTYNDKIELKHTDVCQFCDFILIPKCVGGC